MEKQIKILDCKVADIDGKKRMVKAYYSAFGNVDSDGDIIERGAGRKTIKENGPEGKDIIRHFLNHSFKANPEVLTIGKIKEIGEDDHGNYFWSKIARTALGEDIYKMYEDDMINNHSFGFIPIKQKVIDGINHIYEYKMFEISTVTTWSANEKTPTIEVKEGEPKIITPELNTALFIEPSRYTLDQKAAMQTIFKLTKFNF